MRVDLGPVQETLLIPLFGRAQETLRRGGLVHDPKAVQVVRALDYDFDKWRGKPSLIGASLRTRMFDDDVEDFLAAHPGGTVIEVDCGLNTRYERIDNGRAHWVLFDLPDVMALREKFFKPMQRQTVFAADATDTSWYEAVAVTPGPWCFVSESSLIYLNEPEVHAVVQRLRTRFAGSRLIADTVSKQMVATQDRHDVMKTLPRAGWFRWGCDDPAQLSTWGLTLLRRRTFSDAEPALVERLPFRWKWTMRLLPWVIHNKASGYHMSSFRLDP